MAGHGTTVDVVSTARSTADDHIDRLALVELLDGLRRYRDGIS
jgi:hypothetical protein